MQSFEIPTAIWINFGLLVAAAIAVWLRVRRRHQPRENESRQPIGAGPA